MHYVQETKDNLLTTYLIMLAYLLNNQHISVYILVYPQSCPRCRTWEAIISIPTLNFHWIWSLFLSGDLRVTLPWTVLMSIWMRAERRKSSHRSGTNQCPELWTYMICLVGTRQPINLWEISNKLWWKLVFSSIFLSPSWRQFGEIRS